MRLLDAEWTPVINLLILSCECGNKLIHPANHWGVRCPKCGKTENLGTLRDFIDNPQEERKG